MAACGASNYDLIEPTDCDSCLKVIRSTKTVRVPCTYNTYKQYTVKVPRQVKHQVPRTVHYTDYETRHKQVPYTVNRQERRTRMETQKYQVPVQRCYVTMQTKERQVPVPYFVNVPETKYRTVSHRVPVQRSKTEMDTVTKTVYDTQHRQRCVTQTKVCSKVLPVYTAVSKPCGTCKPGGDCPVDVLDDFSRIDKDGDGNLSYNEVAFDIADANKNGQIDPGEYYDVGAVGNTTGWTGNTTRWPEVVPGVVDDFNRIDKDQDGTLNYNEVAFDIADVNKDSKLSFGEYYDARSAGYLNNTAVKYHHVL